MNSKIRIGIIGVGQIGKAHLKRYSAIPDAEVVAIADINDVEAQRVADLYKIPSVYQNFRELLQRDDIVAVDVCLHNNFHRPVTLAALEAGKHVYCEKPIAGSYIDAEAMVAAAKQSGLNLYIQLATLFAIETKAARAVIEQGLIGNIYHARSTGFRRRGRPYVDGYGTAQFVQKHVSAGGAMFDMGVYHISAVLYLMGNPKPERISGKTYQEIDMDKARRDSSGYNVEELGLGLVRFSEGVTLDILEAWAINLDKMDGSCIFGSNGGIRLDPFGYYFSHGDLDFNSSVDTRRI
jgi:predicted dehydrogenase